MENPSYTAFPHPPTGLAQRALGGRAEVFNNIGRADEGRRDALAARAVDVGEAPTPAAIQAASTLGAAWMQLGDFPAAEAALREGLVDANPAKPLRNPRRDRKLPHFLSTDEIGKLLDAPPRKQLGLRDRAMLETTYSAGLRVSELVGINDGDLDLEEGLVRIRGKWSPEDSE